MSERARQGGALKNVPADPQEQETVPIGPVTFYAWIDGGDRSHPSSLTIRIGGGTKVRDPETGRIAMVDPYHEVRFNMGQYRTSEPTEIREIRKMIEAGDTITEDYELYLGKILDPKKRAEQLARKAASQGAELAEANKEIERLKAQLAGQS